MKKLTFIFSLLLLLNSCIDDDLDFGAGSSNDNFVELTGEITTRTLNKGVRYLIKGQTFVRSGQVLTIQPGAVIFGDKASKGTLIIDKGGKLIAEGTLNEPIVFTSSQRVESRDRGDWGGLVILGNARVNQVNPIIEGISPSIIFGGNNDDDSSGILKYVRVEYAGIELTPNNETNSITMGGVGKGTLMEYCQVSYGGDDGFEWFGGNVDGKYFISLGMWDDCFDVDYGWSGHLQFALSVRYPSFADQSGSNIIEADSGPTNSAVPFLTNGKFSNITGIGPIYTNTFDLPALTWNPTNSNYQHSLDLRRRVALTIANSVFVGMPRGIRFNQQTVYDNYLAGEGVLINNIMSAPRTTYTAGEASFSANDIKTYWETNNVMNISNDVATFYSQLGLNPNIFYGNNTTNFYPSNPTFEVTSGTLTSGASFAHPKLQSSFFQNVAFRGAFGATDWTAGWAEFVPNLKQY